MKKYQILFFLLATVSISACSFSPASLIRRNSSNISNIKITASKGNLVIDEDGKTATYGFYPQSYVSDEDLINRLEKVNCFKIYDVLEKLGIDKDKISQCIFNLMVEDGYKGYRYTLELGDIDIDLCPSKRPLILQKIKEERGANFSSEIDELSRENLGCTLIATFGTEGTKSAVLTACRGYRGVGSGYTTQVKGGGLVPESEVGEIIYHDGIDVDTAQYLSSLIPSERGFLWPLKAPFT